MKGPYDDIINLPRHVSAARPHMPMKDRAAQFAPFAALTGYEDAVREAARLTEGKIELSEDAQAALDLKDVLTRLTEENEELRRLARRAEIAAAFAEDDLRRFRERTEVEKLQSRVQEELQDLRRARAQRAEKRQAAWEEAFRRRTAAKLEALDTIAKALETCRDHLDSLPELTGEALEERRADLEDAIVRLRRREAVIRAQEPRSYRRSLRILRGNPSAAARGFGEALETLRELTGRR